MHDDKTLSLALDREQHAIHFSRLLWSSAASTWSGFQLERHAVEPAGRLQDFSVPEVLIGLCLRGTADLTIGTDAQARRVTTRPGCFTLLVAGGDQKPIQWMGARETLYLAMEFHEVDRLLGTATGSRRNRFGLAPQYAMPDRQVARLMLNMLDEAEGGSPAGQLYGDALCVALTDYLWNTYGRLPQVPSRPGRLSGAMAARLEDFMLANLDRNVSLVELGELVGLSPHHFSLVFRNTFGTSPHRYLLMQRVERAKRLLQGGRAIGEVALEVGFSSQSHFTRIFHRLIGETPRGYARARAA